MKKAVAIFLGLSLLVMFSSCTAKAKHAMSTPAEGRYVYLVAGFDDAAQNTDVLFTVSYDFAEESVYVAQIPRDTYFGFGYSQNKLNQLYSSRRLSGDDENTAMSRLCESLEEAFGARFNGYLGITVSGFKKIIDAIGGIDIEIPKDMVISAPDGNDELHLKKGVNHITGKEAESFVRFRSGYVTADLGRMDAQKLFLNAIFKKASEGMGLPQLMSLAGAAGDDLITNVRVSDGISLISKILRRDGEKKIFYVTMPGEAIQNKNGISFYVLNRKGSAEISRKYMNAKMPFDLKRIFYNSGELGFANIYDDEDIEYREYSNKTLSEINIR